MKICIPAWRENHYVSLAELLQLIGKFYPERDWSMRVDEAAPEPGADQLEAIDSNALMRLSELLALVSPNIQLVDGEVVAKDRQGVCLRLRAVDSTSWDIETKDSLACSEILSTYPDAFEIYC